MWGGGTSALGVLAHPGSVKATATEAAVAVATSVELASSVHFFSDQCPGAKNRLGLGGLFPNLKAFP